MKRIGRFFNLIKNFFIKLWIIECPECKGKMTAEFLDMKWDRLVYKCKKCNRRWM